MVFTLTPALPRRRPGCPEPRVLEAHSVGEATRDPALSEHLAQCDSCHRYVAALQAHGESFQAQRPMERFLEQLDARRVEPKRSGRPAVLAWLVPLGLVATLAVLWVDSRAKETTRPGADIEQPGFTFKGASIAVYVRRGDTPPRPLLPGETLAAGDALRFDVRTEQAGHAVVLERDGAGRVTVLAPFDATAPQAVGVGTTTLDDSAVLDDTPGPVHLVAVVAPSPFELAAIRAQLLAPNGTEPGAVRCDGCTVQVMRFEKHR